MAGTPVVNSFLSVTDGSTTVAADSPRDQLSVVGTGAATVSVSSPAGVATLTVDVPEGPWHDVGPDATTESVQSLINSLTSGVVSLSDRNYTFGPLTMKSGVYLHSQNAKVNLVDNAPDSGRLLEFVGVNNTGILGRLTLDGNKVNQTYVDDGHGQIGVYIGAGSSNLHFGTVVADNFSQDGLYIGQSVAPSDIHFDTIVADSAIRNGVSVTNVDGLYIKTLIGRNTSGASPGYGVDLETNAVGNLLNVNIGTLHVYDNNTHGLGIGAPAQISASITIGKLISHDNGANGAWIENVSGVTILDSDVHDNAANGYEIPRNVSKLKINGSVYRNGNRGISMVMTSQTVASSDIDISGVRVFNNSQNTPNANDGIRFSSDSSSFKISKINAENVWCYDDQVTHTQRYGFTADANVDGLVFKGRLFGNVTGTHTSAAVNSNITDLAVQYLNTPNNVPINGKAADGTTFPMMKVNTLNQVVISDATHDTYTESNHYVKGILGLRTNGQVFQGRNASDAAVTIAQVTSGNTMLFGDDSMPVALKGTRSVLPGVVQTSVASVVTSASTISPVYTGPIFHVSGTAAINTITLPYTAFTGTITIIPDGAFTTTTAGNIATVTTAVIGKPLHMTYDGTKWYPSY